MVRIGRADHHRFQVLGVQRVEHFVGDARFSGPRVLQAAHRGVAAQLVVVLLERHRAVVGEHVGAHRVVAHRQHQRFDAQAPAEVEGDLGKAALVRQALGAQQWRGERLVAQQRAVGSAELLQHALQRARLALGFPARRGARDAGEREQRGVEIGREGEAEMPVVVARVDHHGEIHSAQPVQAIGKLGAAHLRGQNHHGPHAR